MSNLSHNWKGSEQYRGSQISFLCTAKDKALLIEVMGLYNEFAKKREYASQYIEYSQADIVQEAVGRLCKVLETDIFYDVSSLVCVKRLEGTLRTLQVNLRCSEKERLLIFEVVTLFNKKANNGKEARAYRKYSQSDVIFAAIRLMFRELKECSLLL
jgi:hypothetical protein